MKKNDLILAAVILIIAGSLIAYQMLCRDEGRKDVSITVDGEVYGTYDLTEDQVIDAGTGNTIVISGGRAQMEWADCPDQICVRHRAVERDGESIICLPNRVVVSIESSEESGLDGMVQ